MVFGFFIIVVTIIQTMKYILFLDHNQFLWGTEYFLDIQFWYSGPQKKDFRCYYILFQFYWLKKNLNRNIFVLIVEMIYIKGAYRHWRTFCLNRLSLSNGSKNYFICLSHTISCYMLLANFNDIVTESQVSFIFVFWINNTSRNWSEVKGKNERLTFLITPIRKWSSFFFFFCWKWRKKCF